MRVALIQDTIFWGDKKANLEKTGRQLEELSGKADLAVLPEMFSTGFCTDNMELAEPMDGETAAVLVRYAVQYQLAVTGSFIALENGRYYNRAFFIFPSGEVHTADKRHLFSPGGENRYLTAGSRRLIVNYMEMNICVLVCYDLRFPVWSRNVANEYDLLVYTASWPASRITVWDTLLAARAIENQAYVCGVNRIGEDEKGIKYNGHSMIINARGEIIYACSVNQKEAAVVNISLNELREFRNKFPVWKDADAFQIQH